MRVPMCYLETHVFSVDIGKPLTLLRELKWPKVNWSSGGAKRSPFCLMGRGQTYVKEELMQGTAGGPYSTPAYGSGAGGCLPQVERNILDTVGHSEIY